MPGRPVCGAADIIIIILLYCMFYQIVCHIIYVILYIVVIIGNRMSSVLEIIEKTSTIIYYMLL